MQHYSGMMSYYCATSWRARGWPNSLETSVWPWNGYWGTDKRHTSRLTLLDLIADPNARIAHRPTFSFEGLPRASVPSRDNLASWTCWIFSERYCELFAQHLEEIFTHAYQLVNPEEKSKLLKLLKTWQDFPQPLFPPQLILQLNEKVLMLT